MNHESIITQTKNDTRKNNHEKDNTLNFQIILDNTKHLYINGILLDL